VSGLSETVTISHFDATDRIVINGLGGDDVISATGLGNAMQLVANGGDGDDILLGGNGIETLNGDAGDDVLIGGGVQNVLNGGPGNNVVIPGGARAPAVAAISPPVSRDAAPAASAAVLGQFMASSFVGAGEAQGTMAMADPHAAQPPMLTLPQHA
jgi:Ca2+-binding RTX toxin-like protein